MRHLWDVRRLHDCNVRVVGVVTIFSCGHKRPAKPEPLCEACKINPATLGCQFELRGAKVGQVCGKRLCSRCSLEVIDWSKVRVRSLVGEPLSDSDRRVTSIRVCPPHAAFLKREASR